MQRKIKGVMEAAYIKDVICVVAAVPGGFIYVVTTHIGVDFTIKDRSTPCRNPPAVRPAYRSHSVRRSKHA